MRRKWIYTSQIAISLVMVMGLAIGCVGPPSTLTPSSTPTPPASTYPADISGYVTIAEKVVVELPKSHKKIDYAGGPWWIVNVSVKNNNYENPITSIWDSSISMPVGQEHWIWSIVIDDKVWSGIHYDTITNMFTPEPMRVPKGDTGKTTFLFGAPNISPSDAQICYRGQEPYSYGKLSPVDKVAVYDWDLKEAGEEPSYECPRPGGLYSSSALGMEATAEFKEDKLILSSSVFGKHVYSYQILPGCTKIELTDVVTGDIVVYDFKYSKEDGYVCIGTTPSGEPGVYWKE